MKLFTQEENDRYFDGQDDVAHRAAIFDQWKTEWYERSIHIRDDDLVEFRTFLKQNNIPRVDRTVTWTSPRSCVYYFRNNEDYLAAVLKFA